MKKKIFLITLAVTFLSVNLATAQVSAPNFFKKIGNNVNFIQTVMELGSSSARVAKGWFTNLDATNATIGSLQISSSVDPGPLVVAEATNPTIRFKTDTDTGIGWLAANKMSLMTNNANRLTLDASGNVGIGTTVPATLLNLYSATPTIRLTAAGGSGAYYSWMNTNWDDNDAFNIGFHSGAGDASIIQYDSPSGTKILTLGVSGGIISMNGNVGIGTTSPSQKLEINGGLRLNTATAKPTCSSTTRGTIWTVFGAAGVADTVESCIKNAEDNYVWQTLY